MRSWSLNRRSGCNTAICDKSSAKVIPSDRAGNCSESIPAAERMDAQ
jgi:hypothetical protein